MLAYGDRNSVGLCSCPKLVEQTYLMTLHSLQRDAETTGDCFRCQTF